MNRLLMCVTVAALLATAVLFAMAGPAGKGQADAQQPTTQPVHEQVEYKNLLPYQFRERLKKCPLAYVPVGSLEWHGEHMCLGNDCIKAEDLCRLAAGQGGGIVLPGIYLGIPGMTPWGESYATTVGNRGVFSVEPELLQRVLTAELENLDRLGFQGAILITGHYPQEQVDLVKKVAAEFKPQQGMKVVGLTDRDLARSVGHTGDHAAKWETSILMALRGELVDMSRLPADPSRKPEGVYGEDPRTTASAELGRKVVTAMVDDLCETGRGLLKR